MYLKENIKDTKDARPCCEYRGRFLTNDLLMLQAIGIVNRTGPRDLFNQRINMPRECKVCIDDEKNGIYQKARL